MADVLAGLQAAHAHVEAAIKGTAPLGVLMTASGILRSLIEVVEAEATPPAREAEKPCEACGDTGALTNFPASKFNPVPCPSCGGSRRTETKP
jgi:hypothetical protein